MRNTSFVSLELLEDRCLLQGAAFEYESFGQPSPLDLRGDAFIDGASIALLDDEQRSLGAAWASNDSFFIEEEGSYSFSFSFRLTPDRHSSIAEGLAFVIRLGQEGLDPTFAGDALGYSGMPGILAVEFDGRTSNPGDPLTPHIGLMNNDVAVHAATAEPEFNFADGSLIHAWVDLETHEQVANRVNTEIKVYLSESVERPETPLIDHTGLEIPLTDFASAIVGFTAANSGHVAEVEIASLSFSASEPAVPNAILRSQATGWLEVVLQRSSVDQEFSLIGGSRSSEATDFPLGPFVIPAGTVVYRVPIPPVSGGERWIDLQLDPDSSVLVDPNQPTIRFFFGRPSRQISDLQVEQITANEGGPLTVRLSRPDLGSNSEASVRYELQSDEAIRGVDFSSDERQRTAIFPAGATTVDVEVGHAIADTPIEGVERLLMRITETSRTDGREEWELFPELVVRDIVQDPIAFTFDSPELDVDDASGAVLIPVRRTGDLRGRAEVRFITTDHDGPTRPGFMPAGNQILPTSELLRFEDGQEIAFARVPLRWSIGDPIYFTLQLSPARTNDPVFAETLVYAQNSANASAWLNQTFYEVDESVGWVDVTYTAVSDGNFSLQYETVAGSTTSDLDFEPVSRFVRLSNVAGEFSVRVPIFDDLFHEAAEELRVAIVPGPGLTWTGPTEAVIRIIDNDPAGPNEPVIYDLADAGPFTFNGTAEHDPEAGSLRLTTGGFTFNHPEQLSSVFFSEPTVIDADYSFSTFYRAREGWNGVALMLQSQGPNALGTFFDGPGINRIEPSIAFSGSRNAIWEDGETATPIASDGGGIDPNERFVFTWVDYDGAQDAVAVYSSDTPVKPDVPDVLTTLDLLAAVGPEAWIGFTSATGGSRFDQYVTDWYFGGLNAIVPAPEVELLDGLVRLEQDPRVIWEYEGADATIGVKRYRSLPGAFSLDYELLQGSAVDGEDLVLSSGTLAFGAGDLRLDIRFEIINDMIDEFDETFQLRLEDQIYEFIIRDDDPLGRISLIGDLPFRMHEYDAPVEFIFERLSNLQQTVELSVVLSENPAVTVSFDPAVLAPGVTTSVITVTPDDDSLQNESFLNSERLTTVEFYGNEHSIYSDTVRIIDDDPFGDLGLEVDSPTLLEGGPLVEGAIFRQGNSTMPLEFSFATRLNRLVIGEHFDVVTSGQLAVGSRQFQFQLHPIEDDIRNFGSASSRSDFLQVFVSGVLVLEQSILFIDNDPR